MYAQKFTTQQERRKIEILYTIPGMKIYGYKMLACLKTSSGLERESR